MKVNIEKHKCFFFQAGDW